MSKNTLFDRVWEAHTVRILPDGRTQLFIGLHLIHEVTTAPAFNALREEGRKVLFPERTFATVDHTVPTDDRSRPLRDEEAEAVTDALEKNAKDFGIRLAGLGDPRQGIVHVIGPGLGLTQPGMTIACGDSHTSTHGAFGSIAFGIGTTQVKDVLASQCLFVRKPKVRQIKVNGHLNPRVYAKDVILAIIRKLGVKGGIGYAYEYTGDVIKALDMDGRMTICNMTIEGQALVGYINPDLKTVAYLCGRPFVPEGIKFLERSISWLGSASGSDAEFDKIVEMDGEDITPMATWGTNPGQSVGVSEPIPLDADPKALEFMGFEAGKPIKGTKVDVAFIGSCTNGRISDFRTAAWLIKRNGLKVASGVRALAVPGSEATKKEAEAEGLHEIFQQAGFRWGEPGCSMCLAMNPDKLVGRELCVSTSNRNFVGRQGSPTGRTILMSPASVVASAAAGKIVDVRELA
uniref:3-isopropylmalate dehydratase n=1 Tax=Candidatus Giovannonibacteria bacterium GW2011_GWF2_42_19 TaxID=1618659 RepID=A0A0G1CH17_9BACT|nr:MAG: 3-isopropylmalate dehydratase, large subunit [Candidatus Giovannonibacteria bacterium GW2011_GWF2_42_19]